MIVALILLVVITLVGLAAVSGTILQQKMAANQYDRETAFQNSEAAMRVAQQLLIADPTATYIRDCSLGNGSSCATNPFTDSTLSSDAIQIVAAGTDKHRFTVSEHSSGQPEFVIEYMGEYADPGVQGLDRTANSQQYGQNVAKQSYKYYRITARSGNPASIGIGERASVALQSVVKL